MSGRAEDASASSSTGSPAVRRLRRRRGPFDELLAYKASGRWRRIDASGVNDYLAEVAAADVTAKDFRTWHATVLAAASLGRATATSRTARRRATRAAMEEVADHLGNTPTVVRSSYVDPRVLDLFEQGEAIEPPDEFGPGCDRAVHERVERDLLALLD